MNPIPQTIRPIVTQATRGLQGAGAIGALVGLKANDDEAIATDLYALEGRAADPAAVPPVVAIVGKQPAYLEARANLTAARATLKTALKDGRAYVAQAVDTLKGVLGRQWNPNWEPFGFTSGSLELPSDPVPMLANIAAHYRAHPEHETAALNLSAAKAELAKKAVINAHKAVDEVRVVQALAKQQRDAAWAQLRTRISGLREELKRLLSPDDPRWYQFGFRRPTDGETPDLVPNLVLRLGLAGEVVAEWERARLADNYRLTWIVAGSSGVPTAVGLFSDLQAVITGLPHPATVTVSITARNSAGESAPIEQNIVLP